MHHANMSVQRRPPYIPFLHCKIGVYRGIYYFLTFPLKHRLWVLVRNASLRKNKKNVSLIHLKIIVFTAVKYCSILHRRAFVMTETLHVYFQEMVNDRVHQVIVQTLSTEVNHSY